MSFTEEKNDGAVYAGQPKDKDFIIKGLEEQNERLYQNQMSIVETNNVLIKRLQEQQATIDNLREIIRKKDKALNTLKDDITWLISGGLNSSGGISIEKGQANRMYETAQQALAKMTKSDFIIKKEDTTTNGDILRSKTNV